MKELDNKLLEYFSLNEKMKDITPNNPYRPNMNTQVDDKIPFIGTDLDATQVMALIRNLKDFSRNRKDL